MNNFESAYLGFFIGILTMGLSFYFFLDNNKIESKTIIKPRIKLVIENNKVDSVYVYRVK